MVGNNQNRGIIRTIVIVIIGIILLSYFGIDLEQVSKSDLLKKNLAFTWDTTKNLATNYIYNPISHIFSKNTVAH